MTVPDIMIRDGLSTIDALVRARATAPAGHALVVDPGDRVDYAELPTVTVRLAANAVEAGIGKGTRVALILPNGADWVRISIALTRIGAVLVPLSTLLRPPELVAQLRTAAVQYLITVEEFRGHRYAEELRAALDLPEPVAALPRPGAAPGLPGAAPPDVDAALPHPALPALRRVLPVHALTGPEPGAPARMVADALTATVTAADPLVIMFTSGSRGLPKGVIHAHGNALAAVRSGLDARRIDHGTRLYLPMPFFWVGGFGGGILSALIAGATLVTEPAPRPETTLALLQRERVTLFRGWPDQAETLARSTESARADLSALRPGSLDALLPPALRARPGSRANLFGMTESFGPYCGYRADTDMPEFAWGSCGQPFPGTTVRITDPDSGIPVADGTVGIVQLRGPHTLRGICGRGREEIFTVDGFYSTGDLGHLDHGFLFYHGRCDDMFKVAGATVYPSEVEQALRGLDGVTAAFVTNVPGAHGDRTAAAVVCDTGVHTAESLRTAARKVLSSFKVPTVWRLLDADDSIPRGSTGKVDAAGLRRLLTDGTDTTTG
ncbi:class I adenylate-forming enzyme family protein [Nocardia sp. alder85J]|uniref:class I adenylate-forming enzyme family protein n=1 Tax=Nocardia sp. alder85J TaxID=2862949 RepID=UPI001CD59A73|nr:long-chain fatty acid--CoA ligase [Nocardia sp. alder85J]MCX4096773.1 long-chain fatty acid--CoA ligase [Nocardia sp. alder85J]